MLTIACKPCILEERKPYHSTVYASYDGEEWLCWRHHSQERQKLIKEGVIPKPEKKEHGSGV